MRWLLLCCGFTGALGAQVPLHIIAVERRGLPPYEAADRIYCLDGGQSRGLRVGDRLVVKRTGEVVVLGHLRLTEVRSDRSEAHFEPQESTYPMKGDLALREEMRHIPLAPSLDAEPLPSIPVPRTAPEAPPREGLLFFLPQRAELSLAGMNKLETWVQEWGSVGRWTVQLPTAKALSPGLQKQRIEALQSALRTLGVEQVTVATEPRTAEGKYDPAWVQHRD